MEPSRDFPALSSLLAGGFNQDFWEIDGSPEAVVAQYAGNAVFAARLPSEVERITARYQGAELDRVLLELGNNYSYDEDGLSAETWLAQVLTQVERERPAPDERHLDLVGQTLADVVSAPEVAVTLSRHVVTFVGGVSVSAPGGSGRILPGSGTGLLTPCLGEVVLVAQETLSQLTIATGHVHIYSLPVGHGAGFHVTALDGSPR